MARQYSRSRRTRQTLALLVGLVSCLVPALAVQAASGTYRNPLEPAIPGDGIVESCADPTVIYGQEGEGKWFMYCTTDPLNDEDRLPNGDFRFRLIPMLSSTDLVNWTYEGDAFTTRPSVHLSAQRRSRRWTPMAPGGRSTRACAASRTCTTCPSPTAATS